MVKFIKFGFVQDGHPTHMISLLPGVMFRDILIGESFSMARTFRNEFSRDKHDSPAENFRVSIWIHAGIKDWWVLLI